MASLHDQDMAMMRAAVAQELRAVVARSGLSQGEVAAATGLHRATVNRLLQGHRSINMEQLLSFAIALDFEPSTLFDVTGRA